MGRSWNCCATGACWTGSKRPAAVLSARPLVALRRGQGPAAQALRELFLELLADEQPLRRIGGLIAGTDIRYPMPGPSQQALTGTFAPDLTLHSGQDTTSVAKLMHTARPILLDLADRPEIRETARDWQHRIDIHTAGTDHRPADALLIRPDAHIAWAATTGEPAGTARNRTARSALELVRRTPKNDGAHHRSALLIGLPDIANSAVKRVSPDVGAGKAGADGGCRGYHPPGRKQ